MSGWQPFSAGILDHFDPTPAFDRMKPVQIRAFRPDDFPACRDIYMLNEPGRFPEGVLPEFEDSLQSEKFLFLVAENEGTVCGCGGIRIVSERRSAASLLFGLVHPQSHGQGLGTTLLLARLALLPKRAWTVIMSPVPASASFYRRFHFREYGRSHHPTAGESLHYYVSLPAEARNVCAALLTRAGIALDIGDRSIPSEP